MLKRTEATIERGTDILHIVKGAPQVVAQLVGNVDHEAMSRDVAGLAEHGYRVLAVAQGSTATLQLVGLIGLFDPLRADSATLIASLHYLGIQTRMLTGDASSLPDDVVEREQRRSNERSSMSYATTAASSRASVAPSPQLGTRPA